MGNEQSSERKILQETVTYFLYKYIGEIKIDTQLNLMPIENVKEIMTKSLTNSLITYIKNIIQAILFAAEKHKFQRRKSDDSAYINHPLRVMQILIDFNLANYETLCAAVLHDTVEDTDTSIEEIKENFGEEIAGYVAEVTDDKSVPKVLIKKKQIENAKHKSLGGTVVKLADKLDNLRSFETGYPKEWSEDMVQGYKRWCKEVIVNLPDHEESEFKDGIKNLKEACLNLCNNDFDLETYYKLITV